MTPHAVDWLDRPLRGVVEEERMSPATNAIFTRENAIGSPSKGTLTPAKMIFTAVKTVLVFVKGISTAVKTALTNTQIISTAAEIVSTPAKTVFALAEIISPAVRTVLAGSAMVSTNVGAIAGGRRQRSFGPGRVIWASRAEIVSKQTISVTRAGLHRPRMLGAMLIAQCGLSSIAPAQVMTFDSPTDSVGFTPLCITVPNRITYEAVLRLDAPQSPVNRNIFNVHLGGSYDLAIGINDTGIYEYTNPVDAGAAWQVPVLISQGVWHHIAFCYDGSEERMYLDGILLAARPRTGFIVTGCGGFPPGVFGAAAIGRIVRTDGLALNSFVGAIDSLRISASARYAGAIFVPPTGDFVPDNDTLLLYNFNECAGSLVTRDESANNRQGSLGWVVGSTLPTFSATSAPTVTVQPASATTCPSGEATFSVTAAGSDPFTYQWQHEYPIGAWFDIDEGMNVNMATATGIATPTLHLADLGPIAPGAYRCIVTNSCGSVTSNEATLTVCVADTDNGSGTGVCDGGVGIEDLLFYLGVYDAGTSRADVDDGTGTGHPDGGVGIEDLLYYLQRFDAGC
jgi:hypothetical protein